MHERAPNAARSASIPRDFVHARVPRASVCCLENCQIIGHQKKRKMITEFVGESKLQSRFSPDFFDFQNSS